MVPEPKGEMEENRERGLRPGARSQGVHGRGDVAAGEECRFPTPWGPGPEQEGGPGGPAEVRLAGPRGLRAGGRAGLGAHCFSFSASLGRTVAPTGPFFPSCLPGTLLNTATYAQALSHVASLKGECGSAGWEPGDGRPTRFLHELMLGPGQVQLPLFCQSRRVCFHTPSRLCAMGPGTRWLSQHHCDGACLRGACFKVSALCSWILLVTS